MYQIYSILLILTLFTVAMIAIPFSFADPQIDQPLKQMHKGVLAKDVMCRSSFKLILKIEGGTAACVSSPTYDKLVARGWGIAPPVQNQIIPAPINQTKPAPINQTKPITVTTPGGLAINIFSTNPPSVTSVMQQHNLGPNDFAASFKTSTLTQFPNVSRVLIAASLDGINSGIQTLQANPSYGINYIAYDNEHNNMPSTPPSEQQDPVGSTNQAAALVHSAGYKFAIAPDRGFLLSEYKDVDWSKIDMVTFQIQKAVGGDPSLAQSVISSVAPYAKAHNPNVKVFVQVNPAFADPSVIASTINNNKNIVDGVSIICGGSDPASSLDKTLTALGR